MLTRTTAVAAAIAISASSVFAGDLADEIVETPVMQEVVAAETRNNGTYVVNGILAALQIAVAVGQEDDDDGQGPRTADGDGPIQRVPDDGNFPPDA